MFKEIPVFRLTVTTGDDTGYCGEPIARTESRNCATSRYSVGGPKAA
jgi:hypothetical protein